MPCGEVSVEHRRLRTRRAMRRTYSGSLGPSSSGSASAPGAASGVEARVGVHLAFSGSRRVADMQTRTLGMHQVGAIGLGLMTFDQTGTQPRQQLLDTVIARSEERRVGK